MNKLVLIFLLVPFLSYGQVQIGDDINGDTILNFLGRSVSLSSDGTIIAIGGNAEIVSSGEGHVRIYENLNGTWTQLGQTIDGEAGGDFFGFSVSLSSDGNIVAIGARSDDTDNGAFSGSVKIYENLNGTWTQLGQTIDGEGGSDSFGFSVSLSSDGSIVAAGAVLNDNNGNDSGNARVFELIDNTWTQLGQSINGERAFDNSGRTVSLSSDGNTVAIGATLNEDIEQNLGSTGHARIFELTDTIWTQKGEDIQGALNNDNLGFSVSLSSDGNIIAAGVPGKNEGRTEVYEFIDNAWTQKGEDIQGEGNFDESGRSVSLSSEGNVIIIGAPFANNSFGDGGSGHARIYQNQGGNWFQIGEDIDGEADFDQSGTSVSISSDGSVVAIGDPFYEVSNDIFGRVRIYDLSDVLSTEEITQSQFTIYPNPATTNVTIQLNPNNSLEKATIYNSLGQIIKTTTAITIDTSDVSKGIYILEVITNQGKASKKLIIE